MPVQINEVVIRAVVGENQPAASNATSTSQEDSHPMSESILVERIMEIIKSKNER